jgi:hypothetical protein
MPRKPPTEVIEHRISLSDFERRELKQYIDAQQVNAGFSAVGTLLNGISWPLLGVAALLYVGFSLDDIIDDTKDFIDNQSTKLTSYLEKKGWVNYSADELGREVQKIVNEQTALFEENQTLNAVIQTQPNKQPTETQLKRLQAIDRRMKILEKRDRVLRQLIADIAAGKQKWYEYAWFVGEDNQDFIDVLDRQYRMAYQEMYGEDPDENLDWIIETGENQTISDEDTTEYGYSA